MPTITRTFVALPLGDQAVDALVRVQDELRPSVSGARWTAASNLHMTLAFLGDVATAELAEVVRLVREVVATFAPLDLTLAGLGAFPDTRRPRVLWAGVAGEVDRLADLQRAVASALRVGGFPPDPKFSPHVTLGRFRPDRGRPPDLTTLLSGFAGWAGGDVAAEAVVVYGSELRPEGPVYTPLAHAELAARKPPDAP